MTFCSFPGLEQNKVIFLIDMHWIKMFFNHEVLFNSFCLDIKKNVLLLYNFFKIL